MIVINNASKDQTSEVLARYKNLFLGQQIQFEVITNTENQGFGRACNQGLRKLTGEYLVILNNDTWLMPNWDLVLSSEMLRTKVDCIGPYFYEKKVQEEKQLTEIATRFVVRNARSFRRHFVPILMMVTRKAYDELKFVHGGLFDERFFVTYEDTDLKERMLQKGLNFGQTGACFIWHHSMGTRNVSGALPPQYEQDGLRLFVEKWGFDPRLKDHTFVAKLRRRWWKIKEECGYF